MGSKNRFLRAFAIVGGVAALCCWCLNALDPKGVLSRTIRTQAALKYLELGIEDYRKEYGHFPVSVDVQHAPLDYRTESKGEILTSLLGVNVQGSNPREIVYLEPPMANRGRGGLIEGFDESRWVDPWGHPFVIIMDTNGTLTVDNPDQKNTSPRFHNGAPSTRQATVLTYSLGPDGVDGSADDIVSWRGTISMRSRELLTLGIGIFAVQALLIALSTCGFVCLVLLIRNSTNHRTPAVALNQTEGGRPVG